MQRTLGPCLSALAAACLSSVAFSQEQIRAPRPAYPLSEGGSCRSALFEEETSEADEAGTLGTPAGGFCGDILLTQMTSDAITAGVACSLQAQDFSFCTSDANSYARTFNLATDPRTAGKVFVVDCVEFGVSQNTTLNNPRSECQPNGPGGDHIVGISVYRDTNGGAPTNHGADLELLGGTGVVIPFGTIREGFGVHFDPPIVVPVDSQLVLELFTPTRLPRFGGDGGMFAAGFNSQPQTAYAYMKAPNCGQNQFTSTQFLVGNLSLVLQARGHVQTLEFVDPVPNLFVDAGPGAPIHEFIDDSDYARLGTQGRPVSGAAADGLTPVLMRAKVNGPGMVQFNLSDVSSTGENIGTLRRLDGTNVGTSITAPVTFFAPDGVNIVHMAFALYYAPMDFSTSPASPAAELGEREINVEAVYVPDTGPSEPVETRRFKIVRPPVVLLHGLHDFGTSWQWVLIHDPRYVVETPDYSNSHGDHFLTNRLQLRAAADRVLHRLRGKGVAATAIDAFGHSMGGILSRLYTTNEITVRGVTYKTGYLAPLNFHRGNVHKLTSVNTPHWGSPVSDMLTSVDGSESLAGTIARKASGRCIDCGAVFDLRTDSAVLQALNAMFVPVPAHALWGDGASFTPNNYYTADKASSAGWCGVTLKTLMSGPSDAVVPVLSQRVGLTGAQISYVPLEEGLHWPIIHDYPDGIALHHGWDVLNSSTTGGVFAPGFPINTEERPRGPFCHVTLIGSPTTAGVEGGLNVVNPAPGAVIAPGSTVDVEAEGFGEFVPVRVFLTMVLGSGLGDETIEVTSPPFSAQFTVPASHVGPVRFSALGFDAEDLGALAETTIAEAQSALSVTSLRIAQEEIDLFAYAPSARATVLATFSDGIERVVTGSAGLGFVSSAPTIAEVAADGVVTGLRVGSAVLTASYGGRQAQVDVNVLSVKLDADANGSVGLIDAAALSSCLTGPQPNPATVPCLDFFDLQDDQDVDLSDWAVFQNAF